MQNVSDIAHDLVRSLKETDQYKDLAEANEKIKGNAQISAMMEDFQKKSMELQTKQMSGEAPSEEDMAQFQKLYAIVMSDPLASQYFMAQMNLSTIIGEIYKIIGEALDFE